MNAISLNNALPRRTVRSYEHQYLELLRDVLDYGMPWPEDRTGVGRSGTFGVRLVSDLSQEFPLLTTKKMPLRWIWEELRWFFSGSTDERDLSKHGVDIWKEWATPEQTARFNRDAGQLGPVYGHQWRNFGADRSLSTACLEYEGNRLFRIVNQNYAKDGVDQITNVLRALKHDPFSTRHVVTAWNPAEAHAVALPACHAFMQFKVWQDQAGVKHLDLSLTQRSADLFLGVPFNVASYAMLLRLFASVLGYEAGRFIHFINDAHIYDNHREAIAEQLSREPKQPPRLVVPDLSSATFVATEAVCDMLELDFKSMALEGYDPHPAIKAPVAV